MISYVIKSSQHFHIMHELRSWTNQKHMCQRYINIVWQSQRV